MQSIEPTDFGAYFRALHGKTDPFPWQERLAVQLIEHGEWPRGITLPTGSGKTAVIDIALFHLAWEISNGVTLRRAPRRIFFVVDRRIVVDAARDRAAGIAEALRSAISTGKGILYRVATALARLGGEGPLEVASLRGGAYRDHGWTRSPESALVCATTVDQIGSRLLFRGYGVSEYARPIHAGLVAHDALVVLDEAHLSRPFDQSLDWVERFRGPPWSECPISLPFQVVRMTATPRGGTGFELSEDDRRHPELMRRLAASKLARLHLVPTAADGGGDEEGRFVSAASEAAKGLVAGRADRTVAVVVNRVGTARRIFNQLGADPTLAASTDFVLLTGRCRPYDRDRLLARWLPRMSPGREPAGERPLVVVATQTIEAGADLDFDGLVTEVASLDALRQRFGRLDRRGSAGVSEAVVLARKGQVQRGSVDPVYGAVLPAVWKWLEVQAKASGKPRQVDFGIEAMCLPTGPQELADLCSAPAEAPVMLPAHIDGWVQTCPAPGADPEVSIFLHGEATQPADVQVAWRADLPLELAERDVGEVAAIVSLVPPTVRECLAVPAGAVRAWLARSPALEVADVEGAREDPGGTEPRSGPGRMSRAVVRWRGPEDVAVIRLDEIRPGDTVVVPSEYGGADALGWNPDGPRPVVDVADPCAMESGRAPVLRLHPAVVRQWRDGSAVGEDLTGAVEGILKRDPGDDSLVPEAAVVVEALSRVENLPEWVREAIDRLTHQGARLRPYPAEAGSRALVLSEKPAAASRSRPRRRHEEATTEDDSASHTTVVTLAAHCKHVKQQAEQMARACGLGEPLVTALGVAGLLHDVGKADPRFQTWLREGDRVPVVLGEPPLAKSGMDPRDRRAMEAARRRSGYPPGARHEHTSVAMVDGGAWSWPKGVDQDLVLHLVGTHHGRGRPFVGSVPDPEPVDVHLSHFGAELHTSSRHGLERLDSGWVDRFWRVVRRYGPWGVSYLEALLRLADQRASEIEANGEGE
ncbi:MAG: type I-U CRISPR-associated helicase/endonuclease Cas3 [Candidatus Brocadiae bacterium]|nr:type I-U CRISPR-associated helicase/endonuclease Cas3 [Myxococcota bacterium]NUN47427.1 type I-U CRISPR-associated helicase/endonuclease Cas3 [Candidatus Brocadiia bacterium]